MEAGERSSPSARLRREDCKRTKHDSKFSPWLVLIGPSDWEDYFLGKEGAARYRVHNLPSSSGPGLYELGIAVSQSGLGRYVGKHDPDDIMVVYLGQADNVRTRLQQYGRSGAHLGSSHSTGHWNDSKTNYLQKGHGLFEEIFSKSYPIVFRWASVKDKKNAENTEAQLLYTFDYAWNKGSNGVRRPDDVLQKLDKIASSTPRFPCISRKLLSFSQGKVGIKINASKPDSPEKFHIPGNEDGQSFLSEIFKFSRSRPRLVSDKSGINQDSIQTCGFVMNDGVPCSRSTVPGRGRCEEHKGRSIHRSISKSIPGGNPHHVHDVYLDSSTRSDEDHRTACGLNLGDGTFCGRPAVAGRKRCEEHKGMRVNSSLSKPGAEEKFHMPALNSVFSTNGGWMNNDTSSKINSNSSMQFQSSSASDVTRHFPTVCGATLDNGSFCRRQPVHGNKRCWQHKGKRADGPFLSGIHSSILKSETFCCGVTLQNGSVCMRAPVHGRKRCEQHKGMRVTSSYF